jgi:hypothetical protein
MFEDELPFEDAVEYFENHLREQYQELGNGPIWANTEF